MKPPSAEESAYLKTEFLERVAHELRGPAGVTLGALSEIEASLGDSAGDLQRLFAMARRGAQRVVRVAERLQQTAQFEGSPPELSRGPCDLSSVVEAAVRDAEALEARRKIRVVYDRPAAGCTCMGDPRWLSVAIFELTSNAIRHAREQVKIALESSADGVTLTITDDGPPPSEPFRARRFQPHGDRRGLGLALALVSDIASLHQGQLTFEIGQPGEGFGARVCLHLPPRGAPDSGRSP